MRYRKHGGLHHWRVGRYGGSFYRSSRRSYYDAETKVYAGLIWFAVIVLTVAPIAGYLAR